MVNIKDVLLHAVEARARQRTGRLASELVRAKSEDREPILAELEFQQCLAEGCDLCLNGS